MSFTLVRTKITLPSVIYNSPPERKRGAPLRAPPAPAPDKTAQRNTAPPEYSGGAVSVSKSVRTGYSSIGS